MSLPRLPRLRLLGKLAPEEAKVFKIQLLLLVLISTLLYLPFPDSDAWHQFTRQGLPPVSMKGWGELSWFIWLAASPLMLVVIRRQTFDRMQVRASFGRIVAGSLLICLLVVHVRFGLHWLIDRFFLPPGRPALGPDSYIYDTLGRLPLDLLTFGGFFAVSFAVDFYFQMQAQAETARQLQLRALRLESDLSRAELAALRSQLHPHFLFNSFNAVAMLVRLKKNDQAVEMIAQLSALLRLAIDRSGLHEVPLRMELDFVRCYLGLEQVRFGDKLCLEFDVEAAALEVLVPNIVLQPLVENAIKHGISLRTLPGAVRVAAHRTGDRLRIEITNDGPEVPAPARRGKPGIGLANARAQLDRLYGTKYTLDVLSHPAGGTSVKLDLPWHTTPLPP